MDAGTFDGFCAVPGRGLVLEYPLSQFTVGGEVGGFQPDPPSSKGSAQL